jgi:hypothetical protein
MKELVFLLRTLFGAVLRAFFPAMFDEVKKAFRNTAEDAMQQPELRSRLQRRIRDKWRDVVIVGAMAFVCLAGSGCGTRVVFIPEGEPVRLREPIPKAKVWVMGADGAPVATTHRLESGWYVLSDVDETKDEAKPNAF